MLLSLLSLLAQASGPNASSVPSPPARANTMFVAPNGRESGTGRRDDPLSLVAAARQASQPHTSSILTLLAGVYDLHATVRFDCRDCTVVVQADVKGSAILSGNNCIDTGLLLAGQSITVKNLTLHDFRANGIKLGSVGAATISGNEIYDIHSVEWSQGGIVGMQQVDNVTVVGNTIHDTGYSAILFTSSPEGALRNVHIAANTVARTCQVMSDCGAIYVGGRSLRTVGTVIERNHIQDYAKPGLQGKGIYLDDGLSDAVVCNNVIAGSGDFAIQIHNGHGNVISQNTIDATGSQQPVLFQWSKGFDMGPMNNNVFRGNTITLRQDQQGQLVRYIQPNSALVLKENTIQVR